jgi:hypothetical protein
MRITSICFALAACLATHVALADSRLDQRLGLTPDQARQVSTVQGEHNRRFASLRQTYNREMRALRRARIANDSAETARLETVTNALKEDLRRLYQAEDDAVRALLQPSQFRAYDMWLAERAQMRGSSRDERIFE